MRDIKVSKGVQGAVCLLISGATVWGGCEVIYKAFTAHDPAQYDRMTKECITNSRFVAPSSLLSVVYGCSDEAWRKSSDINWTYVGLGGIFVALGFALAVLAYKRLIQPMERGSSENGRDNGDGMVLA